MSVMTLDTATRLTTRQDEPTQPLTTRGTRRSSAVREHARQCATGRTAASDSYIVAEASQPVPVRLPRLLVGLAAGAFYAACLGGLGVLVWAVLASFQTAAGHG